MTISNAVQPLTESEIELMGYIKRSPSRQLPPNTTTTLESLLQRGLVEPTEDGYQISDRWWAAVRLLTRK